MLGNFLLVRGFLAIFCKKKADLRSNTSVLVLHMCGSTSLILMKNYEVTKFQCLWFYSSIL